MSETLLEVEDLSVTYHRQGTGRVCGPADVDFSVVGRDLWDRRRKWCGKTATVRSLISLLPSRTTGWEAR